MLDYLDSSAIVKRYTSIIADAIQMVSSKEEEKIKDFIESRN